MLYVADIIGKCLQPHISPLLEAYVVARGERERGEYREEGSLASDPVSSL